MFVCDLLLKMYQVQQYAVLDVCLLLTVYQGTPVCIWCARRTVRLRGHWHHSSSSRGWVLATADLARVLPALMMMHCLVLRSGRSGSTSLGFNATGMLIWNYCSAKGG